MFEQTTAVNPSKNHRPHLRLLQLHCHCNLGRCAIQDIPNRVDQSHLHRHRSNRVLCLLNCSWLQETNEQAPSEWGVVYPQKRFKAARMSLNVQIVVDARRKGPGSIWSSYGLCEIFRQKKRHVVKRASQQWKGVRITSLLEQARAAPCGLERFDSP